MVELSSQQLESLRAELDALRAEYVARIGPADEAHIRRVRTSARLAQVAGRALLHFSVEPFGWSAGVLALGAYKILENMEIGHNVMHGQYNFMQDPVLNSRDYEWDMVATSESWKRAHNVIHHAYTNVIGKDGDFGYNAFRLSPEIAWNPSHLLQPLLSPLSGLFFQYSIAAYDLGLQQRLLPRALTTAAAGPPRPPEEVARGAKAFLRKAARLIFKDYVLFPALAGPMAPKVLLGNAAANLLRNVWSYIVIYCGHLTEGTATFTEEDLAGEDKAHWYARQIQGSSNFDIGRLGQLFSGHLCFQIEHHLYPNIPSWRFREMSARVREICARYGLPYNTGPLLSQFGSAMRRLWQYSRPGGAAAPADVAAAAAA